jgi:hypothetical protein
MIREDGDRVTAAGLFFDLTHPEPVAAVLADKQGPLLFVEAPARPVTYLAGIKGRPYGTVRRFYREHLKTGAVNINRVENGVFTKFRDGYYQILVRNKRLYHVLLPRVLGVPIRRHNKQ